MKWIFLVGLILLTPALVALLNHDRKLLPKAAFALGLLPFLEAGFNLSASPIAWPMWPGYVKGTELSLTDAVAIAVLLTSKPVKLPASIKIAFSLFLVAFVVSTLAAEAKFASMFYGWQILRTVIVCLAVARACATSPEVPIALLTGLTTGLGIEAVVALSQHFSGVAQAPGWFVHQNLLGMAAHFVVYPALAAFLGGYHPKRMAIAVIAGFAVAYAGGSRATIGLMAAGMFVTAMFSSWHKMNGRKSGLAVMAVVGLLVISPLLYSAIARRSADIRAGSNEERRQMMEAASMVVADYPFGVGANRYVVVANTGGYSARAKVAWNEANRAAPVHNTYYLVTAEMGWLGLIAFVTLLSCVLATAISTLRRLAPSFQGEYVAGIATTVVLLSAHAYVEWVAMTIQIHMFFGMTLGVLVAASAAARRKAPNAAAQGRSIAEPGAQPSVA